VVVVFDIREEETEDTSAAIQGNGGKNWITKNAKLVSDFARMIRICKDIYTHISKNYN